MAARARVLVAGSIISSIAYFLLIGVIGWNDEDATVEEEHFDAEGACRFGTGRVGEVEVAVGSH